MKYLITLCAFVVACSSCTAQPHPAPVPTPAPTPQPIADAAPEAAPDELEDASRRATAATACSSMHAVGCDEAQSVSSCTSATQHAIDAKLTLVNVSCLTNARTKAAVHACGHFVACP